MSELLTRIDAIYRYVKRASEQEHIDRIGKRQEEMVRTEFLGVDKVKLTDLNTLITAAVADALPLCKRLGVPLRVWQGMALPRVPVLLSPLKHTLSGLIDLCLDDESTERLELRTWGEVDRVVALFERKIPAANVDNNTHWREIRLDARLELLVGSQALRATGGKMSVIARGQQLRARVDLARGDSTVPMGATLGIFDMPLKRRMSKEAPTLC